MKALSLLAFSSMAFCATILVPEDYSTITEAISVSVSGDIIEVSHGNYYENIDFSGKEITITGVEGPEITCIASNESGIPVVSITSGEGPGTVLEGFSIVNGCTESGAGIRIVDSSPLILNNILLNNQVLSAGDACGGGMYIKDSSPEIVGNHIHHNLVYSFGPEGTSAYGGGIYAEGSNLTVSNNRIECNEVDLGTDNYGYGLGIYTTGCTGVFSNNVIAYHQTVLENADGVGITAPGCVFVNNTITNSSGLGVGAALSVMNCILWYNDGAGTQVAAGVPVSFSNVMYGFAGEGNISIQPEFEFGPLSNFHLEEGVSPCIDAGNPSLEYNDPEDLTGDARWPSLGTVTNDMGAYGGPGAAYWTDGYTGIEGSSSEGITSGSLQLSVNENPIQGTPVISFHLDAPAMISLRIFDISGRAVHQTTGQFGEGASTVSTRLLPPGLYNCLVSDGALAETVRFAVVR